MNCPKCKASANQLYRTSPHSLSVRCSRCKYSFQAKQPQKPYLRQVIYKKTAPRGTHYVSVWRCPINESKYSFCITYGGGIVGFNEFSDHPYLSGCYASIESALEAGIAKVFQ